MVCNSAEYYIEHFEVIDSTNTYARKEATGLWQRAGDARAVVVRADEQTAGRGQRGNVWCSGAGENLLVSIVVRPTALPVVSQFVISQAIALAVRAAMTYLGIDVVLKWPNDIYVGERKLAGILVELDCHGSQVGQVIIGVGLNVNQQQYEVMEKTPVSMKMLTGEDYNVGEVLDVLLDSFSYYFSLVESGGYELIATEYKRNLLGYKKTMRYRDAVSTFDAAIVDVESSGRVCLQRSDGTPATYAFKEVELLL